jgi:hypothetical protein
MEIDSKLTPEEQREKANAYRREYYRKNKDKVRKIQKKYRVKNLRRYAKNQAEWRRRNLRKHHDTFVKRTYGIGHERVKQMFVEQNGKCAVCENGFRNRKDMHIDHDHSTNQIRQLLCQNCNMGIGSFKENASILLRASEYISRWSECKKTTVFV